MVSDITTEKIQNMILFFVSKIKNITSIKLQKAMLFADRIHWARYKTSISGLDYVKDEYGPVMEHEGWSILNSMDNTYLSVRYEYAGDCMKKIRTTTLQPSMNVFSDAEIESLNDSHNIVSKKNTKQLSEMTHDAAWENANFGDVLPYDSSIHDETTDEMLEVSEADKKLLMEAIESENYANLEELSKICS